MHNPWLLVFDDIHFSRPNEASW